MNDIYVGQLFSDSYLEHHGIKGMHWGVRRFQREDGSLTGAGKKRKLANEHKNEAEKSSALKRAGHKALGKVYELNEKAYNKLGNKTLASMNKAAKEEQYKKAGYEGKPKRPETLKAKSSDSAVTKRVKNDYNNLSDDEFKGKYQTTKDVYAKRVEKYGDPYKNSPMAKIGKKLKTMQEDNDIVKRAQREKISQESRMQGVVNNALAVKKAKTMSGKASELLGAGASRTSHLNKANEYEKLAKTYKDKNKRASLERAARNERYQADFYDKKAANYKKGGTAAAKQAGYDFLVGRNDWKKIPYERANGKMTTRGRKALEDQITNGLMKAAIDIGTKKLLKI